MQRLLVRTLLRFTPVDHAVLIWFGRGKGVTKLQAVVHFITGLLRLSIRIIYQYCMCQVGVAICEVQAGQ